MPTSSRHARRTRLGPSWAACPDKPTFHLAPASGWINDPNGLVWESSTGRFHAFYQHVSQQPAWAWGGLSWGHASSGDGGVTWRHEPIALEPTPGGPDAAGCWSGCCVAGGADGDGDGGGTPPFTLLFTGVSLRTGPHALDATSPAAAHFPPVPPASDLGLEQHECQLAAVAVDGAPRGLGAWEKRLAPAIPHAPAAEEAAPGGSGGPPKGLAGFRDPFVFQRRRRQEGSADGGGPRPWRLVLGSGHKGGRGCLLGYSSPNPDPSTPGWVCEGEVCSGEGVTVGGGGGLETDCYGDGDAPPSLDAIDVGEMWECPFLVDLPANDGRVFTLVCVSPYPHRHGAAGAAGLRPTNPPIYWLVEGGVSDTDGPVTLNLASAAVGPRRLDLGDVLYAPTTPAAGGGGPPDGSVVMMAWFQELRGTGGVAASSDASTSPGARARDYAGCLSLVRSLSVRADDDGTPHLVQAPLTGLAALRLERPPSTLPWPPTTVLTPGGPPRPIPGAAGDAVDLELVFERPALDAAGGDDATTTCTGLWLRPRPVAAGDAPGTRSPSAVALLLRWDTARLEVVHVTAVTPAGCPDLTTIVRRVGGVCQEARAAVAGRVALRVVADHSAVEIFAGSGEALATRVYGCGGEEVDDASAPPRWSVFAVGGDAPVPVPAATGWAMGVGWEEEE